MSAAICKVVFSGEKRIQEKKINPSTRSVAGFCVQKVSKTLKNIVF